MRCMRQSCILSVACSRRDAAAGLLWVDMLDPCCTLMLVVYASRTDLSGCAHAQGSQFNDYVRLDSVLGHGVPPRAVG